jgi:hypothetical protein
MVLMLRTGIGIQRQYSQREVAEMLGTSVVRERALERDAATALRKLAFNRRCVGGASFAPILLIPTSLLAGLHEALGPIAGDQESVGTTKPGATQGAVVTYAIPHSQSPRSVSTSVGGAYVVQPGRIAPVPHSLISSVYWILILILIGLAASIFLLTPLGRRLMPLRLPSLGAASVFERGGGPRYTRARNKQGDYDGDAELGTLLYAWYTTGPRRRNMLKR